MKSPVALALVLAFSSTLGASAQSAHAAAASLAAPTSVGPALVLPLLTDKQIEDFGKATSAAADAVSAERPDQAVREFKKAAAIHSGNEGLWYNYACALALSGKPDEAIAALRKASAAGWGDAEWPAKDTDLASIQALPAFTAWIASVTAAPASTPLQLGEIATDPAALASALEAADASLTRVRPVLGSTETMRETRRISEWRVASWDRIAAGRQGEARAEAQMEALKALTRKDYWPKSPDLAEQVASRANAFADQNGSSPLAASAELMAGLAACQLATAAAARLEDQSAQQAAADEANAMLQHRLLLLAAAHDDGPAVRAALVKLLGESQDSRTDRALYARLSRLVTDETERRGLVMAEARGAWYRLEGLPTFEARTLDGAAISPASLKGRVVLLDFWATWCGPCKAELPNVKEAYSRFKGDGVEIIGISLDRSKDADPTSFVKWCQENGVTWPQVFDGKHWESALAKTFGVRAIPFPLLIGRDGKVVASDDQLRGAQLMESIESALLSGVSGG